MPELALPERAILIESPKVFVVESNKSDQCLKPRWFDSQQLPLSTRHLDLCHSNKEYTFISLFAKMQTDEVLWPFCIKLYVKSFPAYITYK